MRYFQTSEAVQAGGAPVPADADDDGSWSWLPPLPTVLQACCCSARPRVTVLMPPASAGAKPVDLLLCGHHFRASRSSLHAAGAVAFDARRQRIPLTSTA